MSPPPRLAPGSTVTFVNRVEPTISVWNPTGIFRTPTKVSIPGGSTMMRTIVMEEAARAGVRCVYLEKPYKVKLSMGMNTQDMKEAKALADTASTPVTIVMTPVSLANTYDASTMGGFAVNHSSTIVGPTLDVALTTSDIRVDTINGKQRPTAQTFGLSKPYKGFVGGHRWDSAAPASRERALQVMQLLFRTKVALLFGNPAPIISDELLEKDTQL